MSRRTVSVLICVRDDWRVLRTLISLGRQTIGTELLHVIVVSSGREDLSPAIAAMPLDITHIHTDVGRLPSKRNIGLAEVDSEFFLTIDADCVADVQWVEAMTTRLLSGPDELVGVGGRVEKYALDTLTQKFGITVDDGQSALGYLPALHLPYVAGANAGFKTEAVLAVGGYDEQYMCGEDVDLCYKLGIRGGRLAIADDAWIRHEDRQRLIDHYRRFRHLAVDQALLFKNYSELSGRRWYLDPYPARRLLDGARAAARGAPRIAHWDWSGPATAVATTVEAAGVVAGQVRGSLRHRVLYL